MTGALVGALLIAAVSTLGDFIWAGFGLRHRVVFGLAHGALLFLSIGAYLGAAERRTFHGAIAGAAIGLIAAGSFYALAPLVGYSVMFAVWGFVWLALAALAGRIKRVGVWSLREILMRGTLAMIGSGIGFYLISGIWRPFNPEGWDYATHWVSWTVAFLPGFLALMTKPPQPPKPHPKPIPPTEPLPTPDRPPPNPVP